VLFKSTIESLTVGEHVLPIVKTHRKKSIGIKPNANRFELHVPKHLSDRALRKVLDNHAAWIHKRLQTFHSKPLTVFQFQLNDNLVFLGESYGFVPRPSAELKRICIECSGQQLRLAVPAKKWPDSPADLKNVLAAPLVNWYKQQAVMYFEKQMPLYAQQIGVKYTAIQVKTYKSRWGSCYSDGRIQFNWKLMQAPAWVIDYVIVHELCHLKHANHSRAFWDLVEQHYPQTLQAKTWLKTHQHTLMAFLV